MTNIYPNAGELELLDKALKDALSVDESYSLRLFKNDYTPTQATVTGDFTPADFTGYSPITLTRAGWVAASTVSNKASTSYAAQTWTCGASGNTIYGAYVVASTSGVTLWADRFTNPVVLTNGDTFTYTPTTTLNSEN